MRFTRPPHVAVIAAVAALLAFTGTPARAGTTTITDGNNVDFDASCWLGNPLAPPSTPNDVPSPGTNANCFMGTYDGSSESTDISTVSMSSAAVTHGASNTRLSASFTVDGVIPTAGSTCNPMTAGPGCPDLPDRTFVGAGYKAMFQVPARQNNLSTWAAGGGCPGDVGWIDDQHEHWLDGFHFFIGFDVVWDNTRWVHSAQIGTYDPSPGGGFFFTELGVDNGTGWTNSDPHAVKGTHWDVTYSPSSQVTVSVDGVLRSANLLCRTGEFDTVYAKAGDSIVNVKGLSTANLAVALPVTVHGLVYGVRNVTSIGGFAFFSDITAGDSANHGFVGSRLEGIRRGLRENVSYTDGLLGISDTLGRSPACPTPTFGGTLPANPFFSPYPNARCHYDDDYVPVPNPVDPLGPWTALFPDERGTFLPEWWDTAFSFIA